VGIFVCCLSLLRATITPSEQNRKLQEVRRPCVRHATIQARRQFRPPDWTDWGISTFEQRVDLWTFLCVKAGGREGSRFDKYF
jgi:hypothetical protein